MTRIVYYLLTHKHPAQVVRLVELLAARPAAFVLIHHDAKSPPLELSAHANVQLVDNPLPVHWGHVSQVQAMWRGLEWLQRARLAFDWVIYLSGQDYPIRPLAEIETELRHSCVDAHVHHELIDANPARHTRPYHRLCYERYFLRRVERRGQPSAFAQRWHPYRLNFRCFAGSSWLNLSARAARVLWSHPARYAARVHYLRAASCPDETVFQTLLLSFRGLNIYNSDRRCIVWRSDADHPESLGLEHLADLLTSDAWFARKFDEPYSTPLLQRLQHHVSAQ
jgi:hypothetical protein